MTNPETWALMGVFATIMLGVMGLMTTILQRTLTSALGGLRAEMTARFDAVNTRLDYLDRDVAAISRRVWGEPTSE